MWLHRISSSGQKVRSAHCPELKERKGGKLIWVTLKRPWNTPVKFTNFHGEFCFRKHGPNPCRVFTKSAKFFHSRATRATFSNLSKFFIFATKTVVKTDSPLWRVATLCSASPSFLATDIWVSCSWRSFSANCLCNSFSFSLARNCQSKQHARQLKILIWSGVDGKFIWKLFLLLKRWEKCIGT